MNSPAAGNPRISDYILNWIFVAGLSLLALNDHFLKQQYQNWFTGKLSDLTGLLIFPMFLLFLFPRLGRLSVIVTGLFFIFWKLPISQGFIDLYNRVNPIGITRVVDYSDLMTLAVLPLSWYFIRHAERYRIKAHTPALLRGAVMITSALIFMATSPTIKQSMPQGGDIHIGKYYTLKMSKEQALAKLQSMGYRVEPDTSTPGYMRHIDGYIINNLVLDNGKDTIQSLQFGLMQQGDKTVILINNIALKPADKTKNMRILLKAYRRLIKEDLVEEVR